VVLLEKGKGRPVYTPLRGTPWVPYQIVTSRNIFFQGLGAPCSREAKLLIGL